MNRYAAFIIAVGLFVATSSSASAITRIALEGVGGNVSDTYVDLELILEAEGYDVDIVSGADIDTLAELQAYDAVLLGDAGQVNNDWATFQTALEQ